MHRHSRLPSQRSDGLVGDDGDCLVLVDVRVDADMIFDVAPRRRLSSASAAIHWPTLGVDALVDDVVAPAGICCRRAQLHTGPLSMLVMFLSMASRNFQREISLSLPFERWKLQSTSPPRRYHQAKDQGQRALPPSRTPVPVDLHRRRTCRR